MFTPEHYALSNIKLLKWPLAPRPVKFVHLAGRSIFMRRFGDLLEKHFNPAEHLFLLLDANDHGEIALSENMLPVEPGTLALPGVRLILENAQKIFIHSLWHPAFTRLLLNTPGALPKTDWIVWGGDLFDTAFDQQTVKMVQQLHGVIAHTPLEWKMVREKFDCALPWTGWGPFYDSGEMQEDFSTLPLKTPQPPLNILVGHRAHPGLEHKKIFQKLEKNFHGSVNVICPLPYGNAAYRDDVIKAGKKIFGANFFPITTFLPPQEYYKLLQRIDVGIFAQERTMCLGSITSLLYLGKKVFIRKNTVNDQFLAMLGAELPDVDELDTLDVAQLALNPGREQNYHAVQRLRSGDIAQQEWQKILYDTPLPADRAVLPKGLADYVERPGELPKDAFWDQVRRTYRGREFEPEQLQLIYSTIRHELALGPGDVLLDLACGNGRLGSEFFGVVRAYHGVDLSPALIDIARENFAGGNATFEVADIEAWLETTPDPQKFTKCLFYGAAAYFTVQALHNILSLLNVRFSGLERVLVSPVPDIDRAAEFFNGKTPDLFDHFSAIGMWHHRRDFCKMAQDCGWQVEIRDLPPRSIQSSYRFSALLTRKSA